MRAHRARSPSAATPTRARRRCAARRQRSRTRHTRSLSTWRRRGSRRPRGWLGRGAVNWRSTKAGGRPPAVAAAGVVTHARPRTAPAKPIAPISRSTIQRATSTSSRPSCCQTFRGPYACQFASQTRWMAIRKSSSRLARAGRGGGFTCRAGCRKYVEGAIGNTAQIGSPPYVARWSSTNWTITSLGGRAPPGQNMRRPSAR